ncbi:MAG TPA: hypothetical protein VHW01_20255 [Polyangiaceae bacterium]|nr:hypothetical protein [Polyangiaceae bacterium]
MDCAEIRQGFLSGAVPAGQAVEAHVRDCTQCADLFHDSALLGRRLALAAQHQPLALNQALAAAESLVENERGLRAFLRGRSTRARWLLSLALPALLLGRELWRGRVPWQKLGLPRQLFGLFLLATFAFVTRTALRPLPVARRAARLRLLLAFVAWCLPCLLWFAPHSEPGTAELSGGFALRSLVCFAYGSALAAPSFALLWVFDRDIHVPFHVWTSAAGVVALLANAILLLHCPRTNRAHLIAGHLSIGFVWFLAVSATRGWSRDGE